jgi:hypothetical protein
MESELGVATEGTYIPTDDMSQIADPGLQDLYRFWRNKCSGSQLPKRSDIDPVTLPREILPSIVLWKVAGHASGAWDFVVRLAGTAIEEFYCMSLRGKRLNDIFPKEIAAVMAGAWTKAARSQCPQRAVHRNPYGSGPRLKSELIVLPISSDGTTVDYLLTARGIPDRLRVDGKRVTASSLPVAS